MRMGFQLFHCSSESPYQYSHLQHVPFWVPYCINQLPYKLLFPPFSIAISEKTPGTKSIPPYYLRLQHRLQTAVIQKLHVEWLGETSPIYLEPVCLSVFRRNIHLQLEAKRKTWHPLHHDVIMQMTPVIIVNCSVTS